MARTSLILVTGEKRRQGNFNLWSILLILAMAVALGLNVYFVVANRHNPAATLDWVQILVFFMSTSVAALARFALTPDMSILDAGKHIREYKEALELSPSTPSPES